MELTSREIAAIKRIAQNVDADFQKVNKLNEKIAKLTEERDALQKSIDLSEAPIVSRYGYPSTTLVEKQINVLYNADGTPKTDAEGRTLKQTKYVWKGFPCEEECNCGVENEVSEVFGNVSTLE